MIERKINELINNKIFKRKAIIITGARQVGKTTLAKHLAKNIGVDFLFLNCDEPDIQEMLNRPTSTQLKSIFGKKRLVIIDEAQRIENIGITAKLIVDELPEIQLILTGSSALDIGDRINESLTGRKFEFTLYPLSFDEMVKKTSLLEETRLLQHRIIYGYYPEIVNNPGEEQDRLLELVSSYLYKDIFAMGKIKKPMILDKLIKALALQIGSEVSLNELAGFVGIDKNTVANYIDLLEKTFIIFSLHSLSTNVRRELKKSRKIYFWDTGVRNALIKNFNQINLRGDLGAVWENFVIAERIKYMQNKGKKPNYYFWRTYQKQEIDLIEEWAGKYKAYEVKWNKGRKNRHKDKFLELYPESSFSHINFKQLPHFISGENN